MKKLFTDLDINNFDEGLIKENFENDLKAPIISLTFKYTKKKKVIFYKLHLKANGKSSDLLKGSAIKDYDGIQEFFIGEFTEGTKIEISFGVFGMTKVPKAIAILSQKHPKVAFQAEPKNPGDTYEIESGKKWEKTIKYTVQ